MKVVALDTHDNYHEGDEYEVSENLARKLIAKGLVKEGAVPKNKMAPPLDNKENPTPAVGAGRIASLSPAAQAYPMPIAIPLDAGGSGHLTREEVRAMMERANEVVAEITAPHPTDDLPEPPPKRRGRPPKPKPAG